MFIKSAKPSWLACLLLVSVGCQMLSEVSGQRDRDIVEEPEALSRQEVDEPNEDLKPSCRTVRCRAGAVCQVLNGRPQCRCSQACTKIFRPVCGSDGKTYGNPCMLQYASCVSGGVLKQTSEGECDSSENTTPALEPDSDPCQMTLCGYGSLCVVRKGQAVCECPQYRCSLGGPQVCGTDGKTYPNNCQLSSFSCHSRGKVTKASDGPCESAEATTQPPELSNPNSNPCDLTRCGWGAVCRVKDGRATCECPDMCPDIYQPVCGSDGKTYGNSCEMKVAGCTQKRDITESDSCVAPPTTTEAPKTSPVNPCADIAPRCRFGASCRVVGGKAQCTCPSVCTMQFAPVCASDGRTYSNACVLRVAACKSRKDLRVVSNEACPNQKARPVECVPSHSGRVKQ